MILKTPLYAMHLALGAKMVDFHGWMLPLHYGSQLKEHELVRQEAAMFDISHMLTIDVLGTGGRQFLRKLLTNDIDQLNQEAKALYTCMCYEHGGIVDDLIVYQRAPDNYRLVLNAARREADLTWLHEKSEGFALGLQERQDLAIIAIQGPKALEKTMQVLDASQAAALADLKHFECMDQGEWFFARTGYTGEDGLEIFLPKAQAGDFWQALMKVGVQPSGLAARDTLRLEAGMLLYGHDMDEKTTPLESALTWTVKWDPQERDFIGMGALLSQKQQGPQRKLVGLVLEGKGIMRAGQTVLCENLPQGAITSGAYSPTLKRSIALARIPIEAQGNVEVLIREQAIPAVIVKPRFVSKGKCLL